MNNEIINEIVKYKNDLNSVRFIGFSKTYMDVFMGICALVKYKGSGDITIDADKLRQLVAFSQGGVIKTNTEFVENFGSDSMDEIATISRNFRNTVIEMISALQKIKMVTISKNGDYNSAVIFPYCSFSERDQDLTVNVHPQFAHLLNDFENGNYTSFDMISYVNLNNKLSKHLYRILKQWAVKGFFKFHDLTEFNELMDIKETTHQRDITKAIEEAVKEIRKYDETFKYLWYFPIHNTHRRGKPLVSREFKWNLTEEEFIKLLEQKENKKLKPTKFAPVDKAPEVNQKVVKEEVDSSVPVADEPDVIIDDAYWDYLRAINNASVSDDDMESEEFFRNNLHAEDPEPEDDDDDIPPFK